MKKTFIGIAAAGLLLTSGLPVFAETATTSAAALIQTLQQQIAALQAQLDVLAKARAGVVAASGQVAQTAQLLRNLREGMSGDDVKTLQAILAKYPDMYPEGLITGFFGKATARAVARFQAREHLPNIGSVGPRTLEKLLKELEKDPLGKEDDDEKDRGEKRPCAMVPPGHLIAPGWLRKHDNERPIVPLCQKLPPGIEGRLEGRATTTPDTTAPVISGISATMVTGTSGHIVWTTNENADSTVWYSTSTPITTITSASLVYGASLTLSHDLSLSGLATSTIYYYMAGSKDAAGNAATSSQFSFTTLVQ